MNHTRYLNTEAHIESKESLAPVINAFSEKFSWYEVKEENSYSIYLEAVSSCAETNDDIDRYSSLLETLIQERKVGEGSFKIIFTLAYESGNSSVVLTSDLRPDIVQKLAKWEAHILITIYPLGKEVCFP